MDVVPGKLRRREGVISLLAQSPKLPQPPPNVFEFFAAGADRLPDGVVRLPFGNRSAPLSRFDPEA
jgi:hypothetical protein